jgi:hypothetical protein
MSARIATLEQDEQTALLVRSDRCCRAGFNFAFSFFYLVTNCDVASAHEVLSHSAHCKKKISAA